MAFLREELAIDLGTANTVIFKDDQVVLDEPIIIAIETQTGKLYAIGNEAQLIEEHTPPRLYTIRPLMNGVIADYDAAEKMLGGCDAAVLLCCTLGMAFERRVRSLERRDMGKAVILDACGSAWVESGCDMAESELAERFQPRYLTDRFSPGYGDLPLSLQPAVLAALDAERRLGIHLSDSFLMTPSKSVTAVIGLVRGGSDNKELPKGCAACPKLDCPSRQQI